MKFHSKSIFLISKKNNEVIKFKIIGERKNNNLFLNKINKKK